MAIDHPRITAQKRARAAQLAAENSDSYYGRRSAEIIRNRPSPEHVQTAIEAARLAAEQARQRAADLADYVNTARLSPGEVRQLVSDTRAAADSIIANGRRRARAIIESRRPQRLWCSTRVPL